MDRRSFLKLSALAIAMSSGVPQFLVRSSSLAKGDKTLVVVQLAGGNDGLNTLIPFSNGAYYAARPNIAISKKDIIPLNADLGMHPNLRPLAQFFDQGQLAWINSVGYPNPNRSHFASMAIWHTADPSNASREGWIGRITDYLGDPFCATSISKTAPLALQGSQKTSPAIANIEAFHLSLPKRLQAPFNALLELPRAGQAAFIQASTQQMIGHTKLLQDNLKNYQAAASYPETAFAQRLKQTAMLIASGSNQRVLYVSLGGFDTHASQRPDHDRLMQVLSEGLKAFWQDLQEQAIDDKVIVLAFSEFGRRVAENASAGTDHGKGGVMFAMGKGIQGGIYGESPDLENLHDGDISYQQDFRGVYAQVLDHWLSVPSIEIFKERFAGPEFIAASS